MDEFIGIIKLFAGNYAPMGWALCNGQMLNISQYNALYAVLGNTYGGDGRTTFALPDLRGRVPAHAGTGAGLQNINLGQQLGTNTNTLTTSQLPVHNHPLAANASASSRDLATVPTNNFPAQNSDGTGNYAATTDVHMNIQAVGMTGNGAAVNNMQPTIGMNYIICLEGLFPSRS